MAHLNFANHELTCKLVYCGPGLSGKTTNLEAVHARAPAERRGRLCSIATQGDRTLFFDYLPLDLGRSPGGIATKFQLYTVPGQAYYASTRTLVLQGVDGVVFVADSQADRLEENVEALEELARNCATLDRDLDELPLVFQWNKQDAPGALTPAALAARLNPRGRPAFAASAVRGEGVLPTLKALTRLVLERCEADLKGQRGVLAGPRPSQRLAAAAPAPPPPAPPPPAPPGHRTLVEELAVPGAPAGSSDLAFEGSSGETPVVAPPPGDSEAPTRAWVRPRGTASPPPAASSGAASSGAASGPADDVEAALAAAARDAAGLGAAPLPPPGAGERGLADAAGVAAAGPGLDAAGPAAAGEDGLDAPLAPGECPWSSASAEGPAPFDPQDPVIGQQVGGCTIRAKLGEGGMGAVYVARHATLGKDVVVKVLRPEYAQSRRRVERFFLEARAAARLEHPNIVQVQDLGTNDRGLHYIVMQFVDGTNLAERVRADGPAEVREALRIVLAVARALAVLHDAGMVHRDVKAENVVVTRQGDVKLIDFGLVKDLNADLGLTRHGALVGTPVYMAPEVGRVERLDGRADLYSLGLTLYYLVTGRAPFEGCEVHDVLFGRARLTRPERLNPAVTPAVRQVLDRLCARRREERYPDARALVRDLEALLEGGAPAARPTPVTDDVLPWAVTPAGGTRKPASGRQPAAAAAPPPAPPEAPGGGVSAAIAPLSVGDVSDDLLAVAAEARGGLAPGDPGPARRPASTRAPAARAPSPAPEAREAPPASDPRRLGPWTLVEVLDAGGLGVLHRGRDADGREVAVRVLDGARRLEPAAAAVLTAAARLEHPHLLAPRAHHAADGRVGVAYDLRAGARAVEVAPLEPGEVARVVRDAASALAHAHERGVVHGAITPASVLVDASGQGLLADLGLPVVEHGRESRRLRLAARLARAGCLAPECAGDAPLTAAADVYALGAVLCRALTGRPPSGDAPRGLIPDLEAIVRRATAPAPAARYAAAGDLARDLERFLAGAAPKARPAPAPPPAPAPGRPRPRYALAGAVGVLVAAAVIFGSAWRQAALVEEQSRRVEAMLRQMGQAPR